MKLPRQLIIIRHGEKPTTGAIGLSPQGIARANYMMKYFGIPQSILYNKPDHVRMFGQHAGDNRSTGLMMPFIQKYSIPHDIQFKDDSTDTLAMVHDTMSGKFVDKSVCICWEHTQIAPLIREFGKLIMIPNRLSLFKYWSVNPTPDKATKDDGKLYNSTIIIDPKTGSLVAVNQSDDFVTEEGEIYLRDVPIVKQYSL